MEISGTMFTPEGTGGKGEKMEWSFKDGVPIYTQIVYHMKTSIARGEFEPGEKLPAVRELAVTAKVNPNTMQKALAELEREKLMFSERTSGRFVTEDRKVIEEMRKNLSKELIEEFFSRLSKLGMSNDEIIESVMQWAKEGK